MPSWLILKLRSGDTTVMAASELRRLYDVGDLVRHRSAAAASPTDHRDLSEADRRRRNARKLFLRRVTELVGPRGWHIIIPGPQGTPAETPLLRALKQVSDMLATELGLVVTNGQVRPVSKSTFYEWLSLAGDLTEDSRHLEGGFRKRGRASSIPAETRSLVIKEMQTVLGEHMSRKKVGDPAGLSFETLKSRCENAIAVANLTLSESDTNHTLPSRATLYRYWSEFPAFDRAVALKGREFARHAFRTAVGYERETKPLGIVQYDETRLPFYLFDSRYGIPLGRPNLCAAIDEATFGLIGFNTSYKPFCTSTMLSTFRHGCLMKGYVATEYPDIRHEWLPSGKPRSISADNSLPAYSLTLKELCEQIDCEEAWCGPRTPWSKPLIENFFRVLNQLLLRHLPGFDPGTAVHVRDYNPKEHGVIDMRLFIYIFHRWVLHIYHRKVNPLLGRCPDEAWADLTTQAPAGMLDSRDDIDSLFSTLCEGRLDHRGVLLNAIWYSSEELRDVRMAYGAKSMRVRCKLNEDDVSVLRVEHPRDKGRWMRLPARRPLYAPGTSNHIHELVRKGVAAKGREFDENTAQAELRELTDLFLKASQIYDADRTRVLLARAEGFGSENLFDGMDLAGKLGPAKGPFAGSRLNPITDGRHAPVAASHVQPENPTVAPSRPTKPRKTDNTAPGPGLEFDTFEVFDSVEQR